MSAIAKHGVKGRQDASMESRKIPQFTSTRKFIHFKYLNRVCGKHSYENYSLKREGNNK